MKAQEHRCPYCGARLVAEEGLSAFFCQYCGGKIRVDSSDKQNVELRRIEHAETMKELENAHDFRTMDHIEKIQAEANSQERFRARRNGKRGFARGCVTVILTIILAFVALVAIIIGVDAYNRQQPTTAHQREVKRLTEIEQDVFEYIKAGDYNKALVKANTIHYTLTESWDNSGSVDQWDERREEIIRTIYQVSGMATPTPVPIPDIVYMKGASAKTTWPKGNIARYIPVAASDDIVITWERETGFDLRVNNFSQELFATYCDMCWDMGFTLNYDKTDRIFRADHVAGYHLSLEYSKETMSIRLEKK